MTADGAAAVVIFLVAFAACSGGRTAPDASGLPVLNGAGTLEPVDEAGSDPTFARFRERLLGAIQRRDTAALLAVVATDIRNTFGDDNGIDAFRRMWRPGAADSELWPVLERVLRNGGALRVADGDTLFLAPYVYANWPAEHDAFGNVATLSDDVIARAAPDPAAPALGRLPHRIVAWNGVERDGWTRIELADGRSAWIRSDAVYSPVGYRAIFERRGGAWRMAALIAGD